VPDLSPTLFIAFLGGILPSLLWLTFWLFEDRYHPEPKKYLFLTYVLGGLIVWPVLKLEQLAMLYASGTMVLLCWAFIEEAGKTFAAFLGGLLWPVYDEPIDAVIYLVTAALGFAAVENTLFLMSSFDQGLAQVVVTGDLRFIGATLLHTLASATVGLALALSYTKSIGTRRFMIFFGVVLATTLHTLFNFFILKGGNESTFSIFFVIWLGIIGVLLLMERIKMPLRSNNPDITYGAR
jgi:protease PrsW